MSALDNIRRLIGRMVNNVVKPASRRVESSKDFPKLWHTALILLAAAIFPFFCLLLYGDTISTNNASRFVGWEKTVCGTVVEVSIPKASVQGQMYINFERKFPRQVFSAVVWDEYKVRFDERQVRSFVGQRACVEGTIGSYRGRPQVTLTDSKQLVPYRG